MPSHGALCLAGPWGPHTMDMGMNNSRKCMQAPLHAISTLHSHPAPCTPSIRFNCVVLQHAVMQTVIHHNLTSFTHNKVLGCTDLQCMKKIPWEV